MMKTNKKILSIVLAVLMLLSAIPFAASAANPAVPEVTADWILADGIYYTVDEDGNATIRKPENLLSGDVVIPDTIDGHTVVAIGDYAYYSMEGMTSVVIPDSVVTIGNGAFYSNWHLKSVTLGANVAVIGNGAFFDCMYLAAITIPKSVTSIGQKAFGGCMLKDVTYEGTQEDWDNIVIGEGALPNNATVDVHVHDYSAVVTKEADCNEEGERVYTCAGCGDVYTEAIPRTEHAYVVDEVEAATCTRYGKSEGKHCTICGEVVVAQDIVRPLDFVDEDGDKKCDNCGLSKIQHMIRWYAAIILHLLEMLFTSLCNIFGQKAPYVNLLDTVRKLQAKLG